MNAKGATMSSLNDKVLSVQYVTCKVCAKEHKKFNAGRYPNGKDVRFVDDNDREWSGRVCPTCHSTRNAKRQKTKRLRKKLYV